MEISRTELTHAVATLLASNALPTDDLGDPAVELFAAVEGPLLLGVVGLQWLDGCALLRSLAVASSARNRGLGAQLCDAAMREASARTRQEVWLLTTSAAEFFARRGFVAVPRDPVPAAVRATAQFASLCPSSAVVMRRAL